MVHEKLIKLMNDFMNNSIEKAENFCDQYMDMFYDYNEKLDQEVDTKVFDIFDDINLLCDSYEDDEAIRESDSNCIDESKLREKLQIYLNRLKQHNLS